ncbi:MAG: glycosyltransferase family 9 protein [Phycisphaera sp.]|nr:glycosyltransferase family 9 protein [Phycisphaera sp.]
MPSDPNPSPTMSHLPAAKRGYRLAMPPGLPSFDIAPDCRHYRGDKPCLHNRLCKGCEHYEPYAQRICVIKLGALGDVVRTLCILPELRKRYPQSHITWVSLPNGCRMIDGHPMIDRVIAFETMACVGLTQEVFDLVINLDKEQQPCALAMSLFARKKLGVGLSDFGTPIPINEEAQHYFNLGLSDDLKFRQNTKSYPRLVYEAFGWQYRGQRYELPRSEEQRDRMMIALASLGWRPGAVTVGVNVGAGKVFANKMWPPEKTAEVIARLVNDRPEVQVLLLGGPGERHAVDTIKHILADTSPEARVTDPGTEHSEQAFVALVDCCDALFTGDTMAMHVAIALGKRVVAFFGPTCEQEIELFGRGEKLVAQVPCGPCYKRRCDHDHACIDAVTTQQAVDAIGRSIESLDTQANRPQTVNEPSRSEVQPDDSPIPAQPVRSDTFSIFTQLTQSMTNKRSA